MKKWAYAACTAALIVGTAQAAAAVLVVRSSGPSAKIYKTGKALPDNSKITLKANDTVTLLDSRGTRTLRGPGTFDVSASAGGSTSAIAALSGSNARRRTVGASRGEHNPRALCREGEGACLAYARTGPGHHGHAALQNAQSHPLRMSSAGPSVRSLTLTPSIGALMASLA